MSFRPTQKYFGAEKHRNQDHGDVFVRLVKIAFGQDTAVMIGHHVAYQFDGNIETEDEIPSADTVLFDHSIMGAVFGDDAVPLMQRLAALKPGERENAVKAALDAIEAPQAAAA